MITLTELQTEMLAVMAATPGIAHLIRVVTEDQATARLHDRSDACLLYTMPSFQQTGDTANPASDHAIIVWVVEKPSRDNTEEEEGALYEKLQDLIVRVKEYIRESQENGCGIWWRLNINSISIEPEYNFLGGFNGWAMAVNF